MTTIALAKSVGDNKQRFVLLSALMLTLVLFLSACAGAAGAADRNINGTSVDDMDNAVWVFEPNGEFSVHFSENWHYNGNFEIEDDQLSLVFDRSAFFGVSVRDMLVVIGESNRGGFTIYDQADVAQEWPVTFTRTN